MKTNVLIIHADQLRRDCLEPYGNAQVRTPNLSALAEEGVTFHNHFCTYPICTPSRYSLLSGQYARQHLGWGNHCTLPSGIDTFPKALRRNGWKNAAVGKMHFTPTYLDVGFDRMVLAEQDGDGRFEDDYHRMLMSQNQIDRIDIMDQREEYRCRAPEEYFKSFGSQASDLPENLHSTRWITDKALEELAGWDEGGGNLLMVGYIKPHHPFDPPQRYASLYDPEEMQLLPGYTEAVLDRDYSFSRGYFDNAALTVEALKKMMAMYYATITQIDDCVGELLQFLKQRGMYESTMILFTSDHGDFLGFHHMALKLNYMYDPLMRIPLIIRYPEGIHGGDKEDNYSSNIQVASEILRVCGVNPSEGFCGKPIRESTKYIFGEQMIYRGKDRRYCYMVRSAEYKLLLDGTLGDGLLFDLRKDSLEMENLWDCPEADGPKEELMRALFEWLAFGGASMIHLDEDAPVNVQSNKSDQEAKRVAKEYFKSRF